MYRSCLLLFILIVICCLSCNTERYSDALSPEESLAHFQIADGFKIELFAAEPFVQDPVAMIFDEKGEIYVVEMPDYPYKPEPGMAKGRIRKIVDTDGDGRIDQATTFADSLSEATSILPWKDGLLVCTAPYILYLKDLDGDGMAEEKEILFSGFFENNSEAQITNLRFGVDNWIYAANYGQAGEITFHRRPDLPPLQVRGGDIRFRLDRNEFELATGPTQFGQALDDWGHRFMSQNTLHLRQAVIPWRYLHRHPYLPSTNGLSNISDHELEMFQLTPPPYWRAERTRRRQKKYEEQNLDRVEYAEDHFTGASGATYYGGHAYPEAYQGNIFVGDVAGNLVHRDVLALSDQSPVFIASRTSEEQDREFLATTDPWFRPANFTVGPDGCLYVLDYYRQHIETPLSIPEDLKADMDFYRGSDQGRIYRIVPVETPPKPLTPILSDMSSSEWVQQLAHPNQWHRMQVQRLLVQQGPGASMAEVEEMFVEHPDPKARLSALYVLEAWDGLTETIVEKAMTDPHVAVREHGMMLSERYDELLPQLLSATEDSHPRVAFQASLSLGEFTGNVVIDGLAKVLERRGQDPWFRLAVLSSERGSSVAFLTHLAKKDWFNANPEPHMIELLEDLGHIIGARHEQSEVLESLQLMIQKSQNWQFPFILGLSKGLSKYQHKLPADPGLTELLKKMEEGANEELKQILEGLSEQIDAE